MQVAVYLLESKKSRQLVVMEDANMLYIRLRPIKNANNVESETCPTKKRRMEFQLLS
jgi:hypothetical protein